MILIYDEARSPDIYYRCGFDSDAPCLYIESEEKILYVPGFEYLRAKEEVTAVRVEKLEKITALLKTLEGPFVVPNDFPHSLVTYLQGDVTCEKRIFSERECKTEEEISYLSQAQTIAYEVVQIAIARIEESEEKDGVLYYSGNVLTSESLKSLARTFLIERGYDCPDMIIASGEQTRQPHNRGSGPIRSGPVIIDIFPQSEKTKYHGDMTRTVLVGNEGKEYLDAVQKVAAECVAKCVPGMKVQELYDYSLQRLEELGFTTTNDKGMIHSLGHGVGLHIHEYPNLGPFDGILKKGMVVTIEPGLYYEVGVRHEDLVLVDQVPKILGLNSK